MQPELHELSIATTIEQQAVKCIGGLVFKLSITWWKDVNVQNRLFNTILSLKVLLLHESSLASSCKALDTEPLTTLPPGKGLVRI